MGYGGFDCTIKVPGNFAQHNLPQSNLSVTEFVSHTEDSD